MAMATQIDVVQNGYQIKIQRKSGSTFGITEKTVHELAKQFSNKSHKGYLEDINNSKDHIGVNTNIEESVSFMESTVTDTLQLLDVLWDNAKHIGTFVKRTFSAIKNSVFGIIPLIRSILYLRYKKKADTVLALEQQVDFINKNIEQLNNIKNMDEKKKQEIIKKQKAYAEAYRKKAEKLRAQLTEGEKEAAVAIKKEDPEIGKNPNDGDFVLEGVSVASMFTEATDSSIAKRREKELLNKKLKQSKSNHSSFSKKSSSLSSNSNQTKDSSKKLDPELLDKVFDEFHKKTAKKTIRLNLTPIKEDNKITSSKFGGKAYWPKGKEYPTYNGKDMPLLAQINFGDLPKIPDYPTTGILQFFVINGECDYNDCENIKVIYHDKIISDKESLDMTERPNINESKDGPIDQVYYLTGEVKEMYPCDIFGHEFNDIFMPIFNKYFGTNCKWFTLIDEEFPDDKDAWDKIYKRISSEESWGSKIGGYPNFTQYDPREYRSKSKYNTLLLQIDSEKGIMWGDCGIANIFININNLKKKKFDDVFFTWDCC